MDQEAISWMRTRPESIKSLMRKFPPACLVRLSDNTHLCDAHEPERDDEMQVVSYLEKGMLGIAPSYSEMDQRRYVKPEDVTVVGFVNGQDLAWVKSVLEEQNDAV